MKVSKQDIHIKKLCGNEWLWNYHWRIARGSGFHWPEQDIDHWSSRDIRNVIQAYKRGDVRAVRFRYT
jgi:hypothetical protein